MNALTPSYLAPTVRVIRIGKNPNGGRDFVTADPHGAFATLDEALSKADFDPERDRLFIIGDLIDRGEHSWRCAELLARPYVIALCGNHEDMLIQLYKHGEPPAGLLEHMMRHNGFGWWRYADASQRAAVLTAVRRLPLVIELETERGTVGMVHGDVPAGMAWPTFVSLIEAGDPDVIQTALWGRERITGRDYKDRPVNGGKPNLTGVAGIDRVYVGHTPQWNGVRRLGNVYALDTGAIFGEMGTEPEGRLTLARAQCSTQVLCAPRRRSLIDIREDAPGCELTEPFGMYTNQHQLKNQFVASMRSLITAAVSPPDAGD